MIFWNKSKYNRRRQMSFTTAIERLEDRTMLTMFTVEQLTNAESGTSTSPNMSEDGSTIALFSNADLTGDNPDLNKALFYYDVESESMTQIISTNRLLLKSSISSNGNRILFSKNIGELGGNGGQEIREEIFIFNVSSSQITNTGIILHNSQSWNLFGDNQILFTSSENLTGQNSDGNRELFLYNISANTFSQLTETSNSNSTGIGIIEKSVRWTGSDTNRIMFIDYSGGENGSHKLHAIDDVGGANTLSTLLDFPQGIPGTMRFSDNGNRFMTVSNEDLTGYGTNLDGNNEIFFYDISGSFPFVIQITNTIGTDILLSGNETFSINEDGTKFAFNSNADLAGSGGLLPYYFVYHYDLLTDTFTQYPNTIRGGTTSVDASGNRLVSHTTFSQYLLFDELTGEEHVLYTGPGLPLPTPTFPKPLNEIIPNENFSISDDGHTMFFLSPDDEQNIEIFMIIELLPPIVEDDYITTPEDINATINVLDNDTDPNGDELSVLTITNPEHGSATFSSGGTIIYRPDDNFYGSDSFTYVAKNIYDQKSTATIHITVQPVNDAPVTRNDEYTLSEDEILSINSPGVMSNDSDVDSLFLTAMVNTGPQHGSLVFHSNGSFEYTPDIDFNGTDYFVYFIDDGHVSSAKTLVTLNINPINDPPINIIAGPFTGLEDVPVSINGISVLDVDAVEGNGLLEVTLQVGSGTLTVDESIVGGLAAADIQGNLSSIVVLTGTQQQINTTLAATGGLVYLGNLNYFGSESLSITTSDFGNFGAGGVQTDIDFLPITVQPVNDPPVAKPEGYSLSEDTTLVVSGPGVLGNDTDVDNLIITAQLITGPAHGSLSLGANGSFSYTPNSHFNGNDFFVYIADDGSAQSANTTVTLVVNPINDAPVNSLPVPVTAFEDVPVIISGISVSDVDAAEGDGLLQVTLQVSNGVLTVDDNIIDGLTATDIQGNQSSTVVLTGTLQQINTTLGAETGLRYQGVLNFSGIDALTITTNDLGNFGAAGPLSDTDVVSITVLSSAEQAEQLLDQITFLEESSNLGTNFINSLSKKLNQSTDQLEEGDGKAAIKKLMSLAHKIWELEQSGKITESDSDGLLEGIAKLITSIGISDDSKAEKAYETALLDDVFSDSEFLDTVFTI
jgi:VCBS repeat-containing protein